MIRAAWLQEPVPQPASSTHVFERGFAGLPVMGQNLGNSSMTVAGPDEAGAVAVGVPDRGVLGPDGAVAGPDKAVAVPDGGTFMWTCMHRIQNACGFWKGHTSESRRPQTTATP